MIETMMVVTTDSVTKRISTTPKASGVLIDPGSKHKRLLRPRYLQRISCKMK